MKKKKNWIYILFLTPILIFILLNTVLGIGQKNMINQYISTEMRPGFDIENFFEIKEGMTEKQVEYLIGEPLDISIDSSSIIRKYTDKDAFYFSYYSERKKSFLNGFAYRSFSIIYDKDKKVLTRIAKWIYD
tara:strand:- start:141 stop:536 length:396 start_codon:yes stop_codon:yes gene_type:complete